MEVLKLLWHSQSFTSFVSRSVYGFFRRIWICDLSSPNDVHISCSIFMENLDIWLSFTRSHISYVSYIIGWLVCIEISFKYNIYSYVKTYKCTLSLIFFKNLGQNHHPVGPTLGMLLSYHQHSQYARDQTFQKKLHFQFQRHFKKLWLQNAKKSRTIWYANEWRNCGNVPVIHSVGETMPHFRKHFWWFLNIIVHNG